MVTVQSAAYTPTPDGGELRASITVGGQDVSTSMPLDATDQSLRSLIEQLLVRVQQVEFLTTEEGGEIRANMTVGERSFVSRVHIDRSDQDLQPLLDHLLQEVGRVFVQNLRAALSEEGAPAG